MIDWVEGQYYTFEFHTGTVLKGRYVGDGLVAVPDLGAEYSVNHFPLNDADAITRGW